MSRIHYELVDNDAEFSKAIDFQALLDTLERFLPGFRTEYNKRKIELLDQAVEALFPERESRRERKPQTLILSGEEDLLEV